MDRDTPASPEPNTKPKHPPPPLGKVRGAARLLLAMACQPVRVRAGTKAPCDDGWQHLRLAEADIDGHFTDGYQLGVMTGEPSGWRADVDLDCKEAVELAEKYLPSTGCITGRPSRPRSHWWYIAVGTKNKPFRDPVTGEMIVELRSTGSQTVVGPSIHPDDQEPYDMLEGEPAVVDAADLASSVAALHEAVVLARYGKLPASFQRGPILAEPAVAPADRRITPPDDTKTLRRASRYLGKMPAAISGQGGHCRAYAAAVCMVHGFGLDPQVAFDLLKTEYNPRCEPPWSDKELWHKVNDAVTKLHMRPYGWLRDIARRPPPSKPTVVVSKEPPHSGDDAGGQGTQRGTTPPPTSEPHRTDLGNSERFARQHQDRLRFCHAYGRWFVWDGARWKHDQAGTPYLLAGSTAKAMIEEAAASAASSDERVKLFVWALRSENRPRIEAMVSQAKSEPSLVVSPEQLDQDPWLFNVLNGTINLRTGELRPHSRADHITKLSPVKFEPGAVCPLFERFLAETFLRDDVLACYVQRFLGMCLSADIREQILAVFHGEGANGKSVLQNVKSHIMGDYAGIAPEGLLMDSGRQEHPTEIAELCGRRLVFASETEAGRRLKLSAIKRLTGDKRLKGRFMRQDFVEFDRTHKTIMVTNNLPQVDEKHYATWRRLIVVPFRNLVSKDRDDKELEFKLLKEAPGILAWLVRGCMDWQAYGLPECAAVENASRAYRESEDVASRFITDCFDVDPSVPRDQSRMATAWKSIVEAHRQWAEQRGVAPLHNLEDELKRLGFPTATRWIDGKTTKARCGLTRKRAVAVDVATRLTG